MSITAKSIVENRKAYHDFFIEEEQVAGIILEGWEIKAIRAHKVSLQGAYVVSGADENGVGNTLYLFGAHISPLANTTGHVQTEPLRTRKLLLTKSQRAKMLNKMKLAGYTIMPLDMHYKNGMVKVTIGLAKGKKQYDKRADEKDRDSKAQAAQAMKKAIRN